MGREIKLNAAQRRFEKKLLERVENNLDYYKSLYSPSRLRELEYLVNEGYYDSIAEGIRDEIFLGAELYKPSVFNRKMKEMKIAGT